MKNMTEKASADDVEVWDFLKKKKKKKHREHSKKHENYEEENTENVEVGCASPQLFEDQAAQSGEGYRKKKKKAKTKEKQQSLIDDFCVRLEPEVSDETEVNASKKKKKKKKWKFKERTDEQSDVTCVAVNHHDTDSYQEVNTDYVYVQQPAKKKRKAKLPEEDEVPELSASETQDKNDNKRLKKKKKKKKRRSSSTQDRQEDRDVTIDESLLSSPEQNGQCQDKGLPSPTAEGVTTPQQCHQDGDGDASVRSQSTKVPAKLSKSTKAADPPPQKTQLHARKGPKSSVFVLEESSSESEAGQSEPSVSKIKEEQNSSCTKKGASDELSQDDEEYLDHTMCSVVDLDTARQELEEFIPHVKSISDASIRKMAGRDLSRFKQFKKQGVAIKFGRFSQEENNKIWKNLEEFLQITGIDNAEKLLFTTRYPEDKETIQRLKAEYHFCEKLSEGIPRPWRLIYYRARKMFDSNNYKGRYTDEEKEKLKKYHAMHGNDWKKISEMMSRSNLSVARKYSEIKSGANYGPWTTEETRKLMCAVKEAISKRMETEDAGSPSSLEKSDRGLLIDREKLYQKLPWTEIGDKVGTRYWRQCKQKWLSILTSKMTKGQQLYRGTKGLQAKINLIKRLYEMKVEDPNEINWEELSNTVGDVTGSYVQAKFYRLKVTCVPLWRKMTFSEIIDYLFETKLPEFEEQLKKKDKHLSSDDSTTMQQKKAFLLSDIFDSSEEEDQLTALEAIPSQDT